MPSSRVLPAAIGAFALVATLAIDPGDARADRSSTSIQQGYQLGEIQQPRVLAMGGTAQAYGGSTIAIYENPANLTLLRVYHLEALAAVSPEARRQAYGGAVVDSSTSRLAGGFGGEWSQMDPDGIKRAFADLRLSLAYPFGDRFSVGVTGRYLRVQQRVASGPFGSSIVSDGKPDDPLFSQFTFDVGAAVQITEGLRFALTGKNLTAPGTSLAPTVLAGGLGWTNQTLTIEADALVDFTTYSSTRGTGMIGAEVLLADHFPVRLGYRIDDGQKTQALSGGVGYVDRKFSVDFGMRRDIIGDHPSTMLGLGLRFFIDAGAVGSGDAGETF